MVCQKRIGTAAVTRSLDFRREACPPDPLFTGRVVPSLLTKQSSQYVAYRDKKATATFSKTEPMPAQMINRSGEVLPFYGWFRSLTSIPISPSFR
jgi:hypothetical protein